MGQCCFKICNDDDEFLIDNRTGTHTSSQSSTTLTPVVRPQTRYERPQETYRAAQQRQIGALRPVPTASSKDPANVQNRTLRAEQPAVKLNEKEKTRLNSRKQIVKNDAMLLMLMGCLSIRHQLYMPPNNLYILESLDPKSFKFVHDKLFRHHKFNEYYAIETAFRVWNPFLITQYMLNKNKYKNKCFEQHLFHGTAQTAVPNILGHNFNWRLTTECWYGKGVYFAKNPFYAALYSVKRQSGSLNYVMIVAKVLLEKGAISRGYYTTTVPQEGHTTTSESGHEIVKYEDACFYPEFLVYFRSKKHFQSSIYMDENELA